MARIRTVKPEFFRHHELYQREVAANKKRGAAYLNIRMAFAGIMTAADREGRFKWRPHELKLDCLPFDPIDFAEIMAVLAECPKPFIIRYEEAEQEFGFVPGFKIHQRPHPAEAASKLPAPPNELQVKCDRTSSALQTTLGRESGVLSLESGDNNRHGAASPVDFSEYRLPKGFGKYGGVYLVNIPPDECAFVLKTMKPGRRLQEALKWRIEQKRREMTPAQAQAAAGGIR